MKLSFYKMNGIIVRVNYFNILIRYFICLEYDDFDECWIILVKDEFIVLNIEFMFFIFKFLIFNV